MSEVSKFFTDYTSGGNCVHVPVQIIPDKTTEDG